MRFETRDRVFFFITAFLLGSVRCNEEPLRDKKHFSLFSVVTFKNEECTSLSTLTGGAIKGTCYTATECGDKKGTKSGNCASGFGVCCIFISATGASATISENRTYLRNKLYPAVETTEPADISYTIKKMQSDICQVRLDFETFVIAGPKNTQDIGAADGAVTNCNDIMKTTATSNFHVPQLCGVMSGEHLYVDIGPDATDNVIFLFQFAIETAGEPTIANAMRKWSIKTSQIPCWAPYRAPDGCHRYFMQASGQIISPNFAMVPAGTSRGVDQLNPGTQLKAQDLKTCLRREKGMCCTKFQVCQQFGGIDLVTENCCTGGAIATADNSLISEGWSFHGHLANVPAGQTGTTAIAGGQDHSVNDGACTGDYVDIPDSTTGQKNIGGTAVQVNSRYCGARFGFVPFITVASGLAHNPVYDCTEPWEVNYHTDQFAYGGITTATTNTADTMRGVCLDFTQEAC